MKTEDFIASISNTFEECLGIVAKKNADYADDGDPFKNFESSLLVGVRVNRAILVRIMDKITRISNLLDRDAVVMDEKISDTISDAINYLAILRAYLENKKTRD